MPFFKYFFNCGHKLGSKNLTLLLSVMFSHCLLLYYCEKEQLIPWRAENISCNIIPRITYFGWRKSVSCLWSSCWDSAVSPCTSVRRIHASVQKPWPPFHAHLFPCLSSGCPVCLHMGCYTQSNMTLHTLGRLLLFFNCEKPKRQIESSSVISSGSGCLTRAFAGVQIRRHSLKVA